MSLSRRLFLLTACAVPLAACSGTYWTAFPEQLPAQVSRGWHVTAVQVDVPQTLVVSEEHSLVPHADIVWREDDAKGDRHAQVAVIMHDAVAAGARSLKGPVGVALQVRVTRFHALTFEAETKLSDAGVHNIQFDITVVNARTGKVLAGPTHIIADSPAWSGATMRQMRARGETQKSQITAHVAATIQAWLGIGPDNRGSFQRLGD
ncbi:MAG: DUF6778 family protein [Cypionkella sp.]